MADINFPEVKDRDPNSEIDMEVLNDTIEYIRPAVQADGGDIKLASVNDGVVNIEMLGACQGCPLSIATLIMVCFLFYLIKLPLQLGLFHSLKIL